MIGVPRPRVVCKVGGSLLDAGHAPGAVRALHRVSAGVDAVLVAGGGTAVDRLRVRHARGELSEQEAHRAALHVLDATAVRLAAGCGPELPLTATLPPLRGGLTVLPPRALLQAEDPLPRTWAVTSDSIAAWCGARTGARDVLLLKARGPGGRRRRSSADPEPRLSARRARDEGLVDAHLPELIADVPVHVRVLDGRRPDRLLRWLAGDRRAATRLTT